MCVLDIILSICLIVALVRGLMRGFTEQLIALVSIVVGTWAAFKFSALVCGQVMPYLQISERVLNVIVFIVIIVLIIMACHLLGKVIKAGIHFVMLGWMDKLLGGVFSVLKAALIIGIVIILFNTINSSFHIVQEEALEKSVLYAPLKNIAYEVFPYFKELLFKQ